MCIYFDKKNVTLRQKQKNGFSRQTDTTRTWRIQPRVWHHFRTKDGLECDAVVHLRDGRYGLIEIKLGGDSLVEDGVKTLKKLAGKIDTESMNAPSFLMVLTAIGSYAYQRPDGVMVVPIGCLKD